MFKILGAFNAVGLLGYVMELSSIWVLAGLLLQIICIVTTFPIFTTGFIQR